MTAPHAYSETAWIPVSERLPDHRADVLVSLNLTASGAHYKVTTSFYWQGIGSWGFSGDVTVTAWMPLPQPYVPSAGGRDDKA